MISHPPHPPLPVKANATGMTTKPATSTPPSNWRILKLLARERISRRRLQRQPEPSTEMNANLSVSGFDEAGSGQGVLRPVYHFNALAISNLLPRGGTYLDLGCGSGRFAAHLAALRPDIKILGVDLAERMLQRGRELLQRLDMTARVQLIQGDMTDVLPHCKTRIDVVGSIYALHHLPTPRHIALCFDQLKALRDRDGCGIWLFDFNRPRNQETPSEFSRIFSSDSSETFKQDTRNSITAAFTYKELNAIWSLVELPEAEHYRSRWMPFYQCHRLPPIQAIEPQPITPLKHFGESRSERDIFTFFTKAFNCVPLK